MYSSCTFQATTCEVALSQYMCPDPVTTLNFTNCTNAFFNSLEGGYVVIPVPRSSYCVITIANAFPGMRILSNINAVQDSTTIVDKVIEKVVDNKVVEGVENKNYNTLLNLASLQSHECIRGFYSLSMSSNIPS